MNLVNLGIVFVISLSLLLGTLIVFLTKNNHKFIDFSISIAFGVMISLLLFDLIPEANETFGRIFKFPANLIFMIGSVLVGFIGIKVLDLFIPDHHDETDHNLFHIGFIASIALIIHNMIEGMALYSTLMSSFQSGLLLCVGIGLHNIPLGMVIASTFYQSNHSRKKTVLISLGISLSTFIGGFLIYIISNGALNDLLLGILLSLTIGMLCYITLLELLPKIIKSSNRKTCLFGVLLGIGLLLISFLIEVH